MPELTLKTFPEPILRKKAERVGRISAGDRAILTDMAKAMYLHQGVGLAAVQVGIDKQIALIDIGDGLITMINPVIVKQEGLESQEEGCLSCPGASVKVKRAKKITVQFLDENGNIAEIKAEGLLARAIQHELDHLSGKLIIDYLNPIKKLITKKKIARRTKR
jgi:peptide deformylase